MDCIVHGVAKSQTGLRDGKGKKYQNIPWKTERISDTHFSLRMDGSLLKHTHTHTHTHTLVRYLVCAATVLSTFLIC